MCASESIISQLETKKAQGKTADEKALQILQKTYIA